MKLNIIKRNISTTSSEIEAFEKRNNIILPNEYKNFLIEFNGGIPERNRYDLSDWYGKEYWIEVEYFYSLNELEFHINCERCVDSNFLLIGILNIYNSKHKYKIAIDLDEPFKIRVFDMCDEPFYDLLENSFELFLNNFFPRYDNEFQKLCELKDFEGIKNLIRTDFDLKTKDRKGKSILRYAIDNYIFVDKENFLEIIKVILKKNIYEKGIFAEICVFGDVELAKAFWEFGCDINELTDGNFSPLIFSVISKSPELVQFILDKNPDLNITSYVGMTALDYAISDLEYYKYDDLNNLSNIKEVYNLLNSHLS